MAAKPGGSHQPERPGRAHARWRPRRPTIRAGLRTVGRLYDRLEGWWRQLGSHATLGAGLVATYLVALVAIELNRRGLVPAPLRDVLPTNHFGAISIAFTLLLVVEIFSLVFALADSVATSLGKQFELLSLILLRKAFLAFGEFGEPIHWDGVVAGAFPAIAAEMAGALAVFVLVGVYYRVQRHQRITSDEDEQAGFVAAKKALALVLLLAFALLVARAAGNWLAGHPPPGVFEIFYTVLIFSDVLLVLLSLRYGSTYHVVFRNSGFAAATILIRVALAAPPYANAALGVVAAAFAVALTLIYNTFAPVMQEVGPGVPARRRADAL